MSTRRAAAYITVDSCDACPHCDIEYQETQTLAYQAEKGYEAVVRYLEHMQPWETEKDRQLRRWVIEDGERGLFEVVVAMCPRGMGMLTPEGVRDLVKLAWAHIEVEYVRPDCEGEPQ